MTTAGLEGTWAFHGHPVGWAVVVALAGSYLYLTGRAATRATGRQRSQFLAGCLLLAVALTWPVADLATRSLTALVLQRLLLLLAVPPLFLLGVPEALLSRLTRPAAVDAALSVLTRPVVAIGAVTVVAVGTLTTGAVQLQAVSAPGRAALDALLFLAGLVLWLPFLGLVPGVRRLSPLGGTAYLIVQSIVPSFLSVVWIFARHPLYPAYSHAQPFAMSPLLDQQLAGFVAKLATIASLWTVAFVSLLRHSREGDEGEPRLTWADVERQLLRLERRERRLGPRPASGPPTEALGEQGRPEAERPPEPG